MRADRLLATLLLMQARGRVTAAEVAAELEVSGATARRDLEALSAAGVPVYPQAGRGGGWHLVGGARTDLSGLTASETRALFLLAGPSAGAEPELRSALRKLMRAVPSTFREQAEAAAEAVVVDPARWGGEERRTTAPDVLQEAVVRRRRVRFDYADRHGERSRREADPWGLVEKDDLWYLIADTWQGRRTFRVDRISDPVLLDEPFERPPDLDLPRIWEEVVGAMERRRGQVSALVRIDPRRLEPVQAHFGRHFTELGREPDGRVRATVAAQSATAVAEQLAGWGTALEVVGPAPVLAELARIGADLVARYAWPPPAAPDAVTPAGPPGGQRHAP